MIKELKLVNGVGDKLNTQFRKNGIWNTYDLVLRLPKSYSDYSVTKYEDLKHMEVVTVMGVIASDILTFRKKTTLSTMLLEVNGERIKLLAFGRDYIEKQFKLGDRVLVNGKYNLFTKELLVQTISKKLDVPELKPIYRIGSIPDVNVSTIIDTIFKEDLVDIFNLLPKEFINKYQLLNRKDTYYKLHFPKTESEINLAYNTLKKEEAFFHLLKYQFELMPKFKRTPINYDINKVKKYINKLSYQLTLEQQEATNQIFRDFKQDVSTYRLIQGDVGSGKTVVSFIASLGMITAGYQVAFMAPTEILITQHYNNFTKLYPNIKTALITSSIKEKDEILLDIKSGKYEMIFGTHILGSPNTSFNNLSLVIIDEQHKFGVDLRDELIKKSDTKDTIYLTATPIPRSLSLTFFGDLDVTNIKEKPIIKSPILTNILNDDDFLKVINILKETQKGSEQSFVVVPAIEDKKIKHSIHSTFSRLELYFNEKDLYVIHGQLKPEENELILNRFMDNKKGILLSTTIIEVGIDIKNATTMIVMGAENFGLSTLHQLRGRVGRGDKPGKCYLVSKKTDLDRLRFLSENDDGFILSEYDLKLRGPGVFSNMIQSGNLKFNYLDLQTDMKILSDIKEDVKYYYNNIDKYSYLKKRITNKMI